MKKILLSLLIGTIPILSFGQTQTIEYEAGTGVNGFQTASVTFNYLSTCQQAVTVDGSAGIYNGFTWSSGTFTVIVNGVNIGSFADGTTVDLTSYIPVSTLQLTSSASTWHTVGGLVHLTSSSSAAPASPTITNVNYCQNQVADPLFAELSGSGTSLKWFTTANGGGYTSTAPTPNTSTIGTTSYFVSQADASGCESVRSEIIVTVANITDQNVTADISSAFCAVGSAFVNIASSETGVNYFLMNGTNVVSGPVSGTGSAISLPTDEINTTTTFSAYAAKPTAGIQTNGSNFMRVNSPTGLPTGNVATLEAWIFPTSYPDATYNGVVCYGMRTCPPSGNSLLLSMTNEGRPSMATWCNDFVPTSGPTANLNEWNHIACVVDGTNVRLYLNGYEWTGTLAINPNIVSGPLTIGSTDNNGRNFYGSIDEVKIWNVARTAEEINNNRLQCYSAGEPNLVSYYQFEEGTGTSSTDVMGLNDLTWVGISSWTTGSPACAGCDLTMSQTATITINSLNDQTVSSANTTICPNTSSTIDVGSTQSGVYYYLRDDANDAVIDGPVSGTGSGVSFNTGNLSSTTTFNVYSEASANGLDFDGIDDEFSVADPNISGSSFSIELWAKRNSVTGNFDVLVGQGVQATNQGLHFGFRANNTFTFAFWNDDITTTATYTDLDWHHWAGTYDATTNEQKLYLDGVLIATRTTTADYTGTGTLYIGAASWAGDKFQGAIDEVRIWNTVRSQTEIMDNMNNCLNGNESGLLTYFNFNELTGSTTAANLASSTDDGTLTNMDPATDWVNGAFSCNCSLEMATSVTITVQDNAPTVASAPTNISVNVDAGTCVAVVTYTAPTFNDDCDGTALTGTMTTTGTASGATFPLGTTTVTYEYTDASSQTVSASFDVIVTDNENPAITAPSTINTTANAAGCTANSVSLGTPVTSDNCSVASVTNDAPSAFPLGTTSVTWTVTDGSGNTATATQNVIVTTGISVNSTSQDVSCNGGTDGSIDLTVTGGTTPITFDWNSGAFTTEDLSGLSAGVYSGILTDANGCTDAGSVTINEPAAISVTVDGTTGPQNCGANDGTAAVTVSGGTVSSAYTYSWSDGGTYSSNVEDPSDLTAGTFTLTVTDDNACTATSTVTLSDPNGPAITLGSSSVLALDCNGDTNGDIQIDVVLNGGATSASYLWDDASASITEDISGLSAGVYSVTVTDNNNCTGSFSATITEPAAITSNVTIINATCNGSADGSINLTATGGTGALSFLWDDASASTTEDLSGITQGTYTVIITDANACSVATSASITEPAALTAAGTSTDEINGNDGSIDLTAGGGTSPYIYSWTGPNGFTSTSEDLNGLVAGTYDVTVTDSNGCTTTEQVVVSSQVSIDEINGVSLSVYPNPSAGIFNVRYEGTSDYTICVHNTIGQMIYSKTLTGQLSTIDLSDNANGIYFFTIETGNQVKTIRLVMTK